MKNHFKYTIIGAGVIGLAIAERLSRKYDNILVIEKEKKFGLHTSSRNSEVIHSGFYYPNNSLKAKLCVEGNDMIYDFCNKYNIPYKKCGKLVVANSDSEIIKLENILLRAIENGVKDIKVLSKKEALNIESNARSEKSLWIPSAGVMDSHLIMSKLENLSLSRDVSIIYNLELNSINKNKDIYDINFVNDDVCITTEYIINCSGLWAHHIANQLLNEKYEIEYYKGDYFKTSQIKNLNCLIYPIPKDISLGIHAILNLNGEVFFGPNVYKVDAIDYKTDDKYKTQFIREANQLMIPDITDLYSDFSGIRPKLKYNNKMNDFIIKEEPKLDNFYNLIGIDSPGLTSSLAIADFVFNLIE
tara:strand:+ start:109 stop:1185 length:1077 start_codon:yes stop_codon:yes gene_type:complete